MPIFENKRLLPLDIPEALWRELRQADETLAEIAIMANPLGYGGDSDGLALSCLLKHDGVTAAIRAALPDVLDAARRESREHIRKVAARHMAEAERLLASIAEPAPASDADAPDLRDVPATPERLRAWGDSLPRGDSSAMTDANF